MIFNDEVFNKVILLKYYWFCEIYNYNLNIDKLEINFFL